MALRLGFDCHAGLYELIFWFLTLRFLWLRRMSRRDDA